MPPLVDQVNTADATFMHDMIRLLRTAAGEGSAAGEMAARHGGDPALRSLAQASSASAARQIAAITSCLDDWRADTSHRASDTASGRDRRTPAAIRTPDYDRDLTALHGSLFDARVTKNLLAHHHAVIDRSRQEMIEGLNQRSRAFARAAISQHSGELDRLEAR
jgi:uncharacterized protein (DUF305 family)